MLYSVEPLEAEPLLDRREREARGGLDMLQPAAPLHQCAGQVRACTDFGAGISCAASSSIALDPYMRPLSLGWRSIGQQRGSIVCMVYGYRAQQR